MAFKVTKSLITCWNLRFLQTLRGSCPRSNIARLSFLSYFSLSQPAVTVLLPDGTSPLRNNPLAPSSSEGHPDSSVTDKSGRTCVGREPLSLSGDMPLKFWKVRSGMWKVVCHFNTGAWDWMHRTPFVSGCRAIWSASCKRNTLSMQLCWWAQIWKPFTSAQVFT